MTFDWTWIGFQRVTSASCSNAEDCETTGAFQWVDGSPYKAIQTQIQAGFVPDEKDACGNVRQGGRLETEKCEANDYLICEKPCN